MQSKEGYTQQIVRAWLRDWARLERLSRDDFDWADLHASILLIVMGLNDDQQLAFELHFGMGYTPTEITYIVEGWNLGVTLAAIRSVEQNIFNNLSMDVRQVAFEAGGAYPAGWAGGTIGPWDVPVERPRY